MMRAASRRALTALRAAEDGILGSAADAAAMQSMADELYALAGILVDQPRLRRALADPATDDDDRVGLLTGLVEGKIGAATLDVAKAAVAQHWSSPWDLTDALELAGDAALFASAEKDRQIDRVEDELFRFERIIDADGELTGLLDEYTAPVERRLGLLDVLVADKVAPVTLALLHHAVSSTRKPSITLAIDDLLQQAAQRQERYIARVLSAVPLTDAQEQRLADALTAMYGRQMIVRTALDASLQGGLVVRVGDEVIDGSIAARFAEARTGLVH